MLPERFRRKKIVESLVPMRNAQQLDESEEYSLESESEQAPDMIDQATGMSFKNLKQ